jgi:hypothetical protein
MYVLVYLFLLTLAVAASYLGAAPREDWDADHQALASLLGSLLFTVAAISSLNVEVAARVGSDPTLRFGSFYLVILWAGMALLDVVVVVLGVFERGQELREREDIDPGNIPGE